MRTKTIIIRCTEEEHAQLVANKQRTELARWLRELGLDQSKREIVKHQLPPEALRILVGIGTNLNQVARAINTAALANEMNQLDAVKILITLNATEEVLLSFYDLLKREQP